MPRRPNKTSIRHGVEVPYWLIVPAALAFGFLLVPLAGLVTGVDWRHWWDLIGSPASLAALGLSLRTAAMSTVACLALGIPLAVVLARWTFPGRRVVRSVVLLPLVLPPVVGGIALLQAFGRRGLLGQYADLFGIRIAFTTTAVVLAQAFVALPFAVISLEGALHSRGRDLEQIAATLGARPTRVLTQVTLPLVAPAVASGAVLCFARSLGEFGATLTFAGSLGGVTRTLPLEIYLQREIDPQAAVALSLLLLLVAAAVVLGVYGTREGRTWPSD